MADVCAASSRRGPLWPCIARHGTVSVRWVFLSRGFVVFHHTHALQQRLSRRHHVASSHLPATWLNTSDTFRFLPFGHARTCPRSTAHTAAQRHVNGGDAHLFSACKLLPVPTTRLPDASNSCWHPASLVSLSVDAIAAAWRLHRA